MFSTTQLAKEKAQIQVLSHFPQRNINKMQRLQVLTIPVHEQVVSQISQKQI